MIHTDGTHFVAYIDGLGVRGPLGRGRTPTLRREALTGVRRCRLTWPDVTPPHIGQKQRDPFEAMLLEVRSMPAVTRQLGSLATLPLSARSGS
jgi:hypothetical protein